MSLEELVKYVDEHIYMCRLIKGGNRKIDKKCFVFSVLATDAEIFCEQFGIKVKGTCPKKVCKNCKGVCYAVPPQRMYDNVRASRLIRTIAMRYLKNALFAELDKQISRMRTKNPLIRLNQSGEIEDREQLLMWAKLAQRHPNARFWVYTKNYSVLTACVRCGMIPSNLTVLVSIWKNQGVECFNSLKEYKNIKAFVVNNDNFHCTETCEAYATGHLNGNIKCGGNCFKCIYPTAKTQRIRCLEH